VFEKSLRTELVTPSEWCFGRGGVSIEVAGLAAWSCPIVVRPRVEMLGTGRLLKSEESQLLCRAMYRHAAMSTELPLA